MRNKSLLAALVLILAAGTLWAQFWKDYSEKDRENIAKAYWLAGRQYQEAGKPEKGAELMRLARMIDPALEPASVDKEAAPQVVSGPASVGDGARPVPTQSLESFFLRYVGALLAKDPGTASDFMDGSLYASRTQAAVTRAEESSALRGFFSEAPLEGRTPSDLYNLDSVTVARASAQARDAWGDAYTLDVDAAADYSRYLGFWEQKQRFFVRRVQGEWRIFAIGRVQPPLSWKPMAPGPAEAAPVAASSPADASKAIMDAFTAFLGDLLKRDTDAAAGYLADNVSVLRLRQSVTKAELKTTLDGSLESADLGALQVADAVDLDSAFVERAQSPAEGVGGDVFSLSVRARQDLTRAIPFWNSYQRYYFVRSNGQWRIFALF